MRPIKFRAWVKDRNKMVNVRITSMDSGLMPIGDWDDIIYPFDETECELMQFTGIFDKNGEEIYEGDIIRFHNPEETYKIVYDKGQFVPMSNGGDVWCHGSVMAWVVWKKEVIGNIYENPELLEERRSR